MASDSEKLVKYLKNKYSNKIIVSEGLIAHVIYQKDGYLRAIIDNELLSKTDELITTGGSTFGFISVIRRQRMGYYINGQNTMKKCEKMTLTYPGERITKVDGKFVRYSVF